MALLTPIASSSDGCAYLLEFREGKRLLLDCGVQFKKIQKALNFKVSDLAGCLLSHAHGDHSKSVKDLLRIGVNIYASSETIKTLGTRTWNMKAVESTVPFDCGPYKVTPFDAVHDCIGTLGFVIQSQTDRVLYLTDTAYCKHRFDGLTHIYIECNHSLEIIRKNTESGDIQGNRFRRTISTHMSLERLIDMLNANDLSQVQEIHLLHLSDMNSDSAAFKEAVQRATGCPVYVAAERGITV